MKLFLDTAHIEEIRRAHATGLLDGVTTNPSHLAKTGRPPWEVVKEICAIVRGPVSAEAMGTTAEELIREAQSLAAIAPNLVVKIPLTVEGLKAVPILERDNDIRCNVTMVFSSTQAFLAMKAGASYVSIVLSRLDACGNESEILTQDATVIQHQYGFDSKIIAGSLKTQNHILCCLRNGVDIATVPESLFFQMFDHPLTEVGLAQFEKDWKKPIR